MSPTADNQLMICAFYVTSLELRFGFGVRPQKRNFEKKGDFKFSNIPLIFNDFDLEHD